MLYVTPHCRVHNSSVMLTSVEPSAKFEGPRSGYTSVKRPLSVQVGRSINPRLEQQKPDEDVKGFGRRKIPTSSQRPTRGTNTSIVYPRVTTGVVFTHRQIEDGDVVFVSKSNTLFGSGLTRFSICASLDHVNTLLKTERNTLRNFDPSMTSRYVESRKALLHAANVQLKHDTDTDERNSTLRQGSLRQFLSDDFKRSVECTKAEVENATRILSIAEEAAERKEGTEVRPEYDWLAIPALQEWRLDGVLHGKEVSGAFLHNALPYSSVEDTLLNVCVAGPCPMRNQTLVKKPQSFGEGVFAGDLLYVCLVALQQNDGSWQFAFKPTSLRKLCSLASAEASDLHTIAMAWKIGRVIDTKLVGNQNGRVELDVEVEMLTRSMLLRQVKGDDCGSPRPQPAALTDPSTATTDPTYSPEIVGPPPAALTDPSTATTATTYFPEIVGNISVPAVENAPNYEEAYRFGFAAREAAPKLLKYTPFESQLSIKWLTQKNENFPTVDNTAVAVCVNTYSCALLASEPLDLQNAYFVNCINMQPFIAAMSAALTRGYSIKSYEDFCAITLQIRDNGLTHALCRELDRKGFPHVQRSTGARVESDIMMESFELPPQDDDAVMTLGGRIDMRRFVDMAPGKTLEEKAKSISWSLNFLFDLSFETKWSPVDEGIAWVRSVADKDQWELASTAKNMVLTDVVKNAQAMRVMPLVALVILMATVFGILWISVLRPMAASVTPSSKSNLTDGTELTILNPTKTFEFPKSLVARLSAPFLPPPPPNIAPLALSKLQAFGNTNQDFEHVGIKEKTIFGRFKSVFSTAMDFYLMTRY